MGVTPSRTRRERAPISSWQTQARTDGNVWQMEQRDGGSGDRPNEQQMRRSHPPSRNNSGSLYDGYPFPNAQAQQRQRGERTETARHTTTITSVVNLKKQSLQAYEDSNGSIGLEFDFDSSQPCAVTVFFMASEEERGKVSSCLTSPSRHFYDKGLGQKFKLPQAERPRAEDIVPSEAQNPLLIRLEGCENVERLRDEGTTSTPDYCQAQTTHAGLHPVAPQSEEKPDTNAFGSGGNDEEEGGACVRRWEVPVSKQKIYVKGVSYELQEIYGLDEQATAPQGKECVICMAEPRSTTVLPCRHLCMCSACAKQMRTQTNRCPICREHMTGLLEIKVDKRPSQTDSDGGTAPHSPAG